MSIQSVLDDDLFMIQVTPGAGTGHPIYLIERQDDLFVPIDGVVWQGIDGYEEISVPDDTISISELIKEYNSNSDQYDQAGEIISTGSAEMTINEFYKMKSLVGMAVTKLPRVFVI